jgi:hypothetical protein
MITLKLIKVLNEFTLMLLLVGCDVAADDTKVRRDSGSGLLFFSSLCSLMFRFLLESFLLEFDRYPAIYTFSA